MPFNIINLTLKSNNELGATISILVFTYNIKGKGRAISLTPSFKTLLSKSFKLSIIAFFINLEIINAKKGVRDFKINKESLKT